MKGGDSACLSLYPPLRFARVCYYLFGVIAIGGATVAGANRR